MLKRNFTIWLIDLHSLQRINIKLGPEILVKFLEFFFFLHFTKRLVFSTIFILFSEDISNTEAEASF